MMSKQQRSFAQRKCISQKMEHVMELKNNVDILNLLEVSENGNSIDYHKLSFSLTDSSEICEEDQLGNHYSAALSKVIL